MSRLVRTYGVRVRTYFPKVSPWGWRGIAAVISGPRDDPRSAVEGRALRDDRHAICGADSVGTSHARAQAHQQKPGEHATGTASP